MSKLELLLLGHFECMLPSGEPVSLSMRKAEVLLTYLALAPGIRHPRERLINLLWSDRSDEQARNSLRQCLSTIRKSLGDSADLVLQIDRSSITLNPELIEVDCLEFERLAADTEFESLGNAAALYRGEFLEGIAIRDAACQEWLDNERFRFKRQYIEILTNLGHSFLGARDFNAAIRSAERLVKQDPLSEVGWRLLMRARHESGDRSHALQAFKRCQEVLRTELDIDPETETIELRDAIAGGEASATSIKPKPVRSKSPATKTGDDHSIAVLPFDNLSGDPDQEYFSDGITDSIILNLALFPGLQVKSRNSSFAFKELLKSVGEISEELKVDYIVEGSIRRAQERIRITVQLIDSASGNQIWSKRYDAELSDLFDLEEDLSRNIAATMTGQIESELQRIAIAKGAEGQESYDLLLCGIYHAHRINREDNVIAIEKLNQCLAQDPDNLRAHAMLYSCHGMDNIERWTPDYQESRRHARKHIKRAMELGPEQVMVQAFYAEHLIYIGKIEAAMKLLDRALDINPNDPYACVVKSIGFVQLGEFDAALQAAEQARQLDPYFPWAEWELTAAQFGCGRYEAVLETAAKSHTSLNFIQPFVVAANVKLGRIETAQKSLQGFLQQCRETMLSMPQTLEEWYDYTRGIHPFVDDRHNQDLLDCLVQAGLEEESAAASNLTNASEYPSILVLPFTNLSGDPEQEYFSDGITESVVVSLSSFSGLNVKSRHASFAFKDSSRGLPEIAAEIGVQYIVEGSIRKFGDKVRITVQLGDTRSGNQVWGKRYDSPLENLFALEEELVQTIAGTVSGRIEHDKRVTSLRKPAKDLRSYDYLMRGIYHLQKFNATDSKIAREQLARCLEIDPRNAEAHAQMGVAHSIEAIENWTDDRQHSQVECYRHYQQALQLQPEDALTHAYVAEYHLFARDFTLGLFHADRSIELNPTLADGYSIKSYLLAITGQTDAALKNAAISMQIDPYSYYMGWNAGEVYRMAGEYQRAVDTFRSIPHMSPSVHAEIAACLTGLGRLPEARSEIQQFHLLAREQMTIYPQSEAAWRQYWYDILPYEHAEDFEVFYGQLMQAGLCDHLTEEETKIPSIAVLPFENMSGDPEQAFFADGITADIVSTLSKFKHMRTVARHSTEIYRDRKASIANIASEQGVRYILEGSVRKSGKRIRVSAELIDSQGEQICWSERYDRDLDDLFAVQDEITQQIALAMKVHLDDGDKALHRSAGTTNIKAWELVMLAIDLQDSYIQQNILESRMLIQQALQLDKGYANAWVMLGWTHWQEAYSGWTTSSEQSMQDAAVAVERAFELDADNGEAWALASTIHLMNHESDKAMAASRRALELEPGNAEVHALAGMAMNFCGDYDNATEHFDKALSLCPICPNWYYLVGAAPELLTNNVDRAVELLRRGVAAEPASPLVRFYLADALIENGDEVAASAVAVEIRALDKTMKGHGLVRCYSNNPEIRDQFYRNLEKLGLV